VGGHAGAGSGSQSFDALEPGVFHQALYVLNWHFRANPKFNQIRQSPATASQRKSKRKGLDHPSILLAESSFSVRCADPLRGKILFPQLALGKENTPSFRDCASLPHILFRKGKVVADA
jgi:hypothetical protein